MSNQKYNSNNSDFLQVQQQQQFQQQQQGQQNHTKFPQIDNSFRKTFDSMLIKTQTQQVYNHTKKTNKSVSPKKQPPKKIDALNQWSYCNPENQQDDLPQPFRFVNKVLQDMILKPVYDQIFKIEKHKENPNYEGNVKEQAPQGSFGINGISSIYKHKNNPLNQLVAGDKFGNLYILDMNKKTQVSRIEAVPNKRIQQIKSVTLSYADQHLTTVAVIARAHPEVLIYRYLSFENKFHLHFKIKLEELEEQKIGKYPVDIGISEDCDFLQVCNYKGDVKIYKIPEPPAPLLEQPMAVDAENMVLSIPNQQMQSSQQVQIQRLSANQNFDIETVELKEVFYEVQFQGELKTFDYDLYLKKLKEESQNQFKEQEPVDPKAKDAKKDTKKAGKGQTEVLQTEESQEKELIQETEFNEGDTLFGEYKLSETQGDISECVPELKFKPIVYFQKSPITIVDPNMTFNKPKTVHLTTGIVVMWTNTKNLYVHTLQPSKPEYLSAYMYNIYFSDPEYPEKQEILKKALTFLPPKLLSSYEVLYPISKTEISPSESLLAIGMKNGTVLLWDLNMQAEKWYLDKHNSRVTALAFFENIKLVSGSQDGAVHIYNLEKGKVELKRTNIFQSKVDFSILDIKVSNVGVAFVIDSLQNLRMYDIYHSDKIARLNLNSLISERIPVGFNINPFVIMDAQKEQLSIICEVKNPSKDSNSSSIIQQIEMNESIVGGQSNSIQKTEEKNASNTDNNNNNIEDDSNNPWAKLTNLFIFKIHDSFLNLFPGYSNVYNKMGLEMDKKHQIINIFGKLSMQELKDSQFEIPHLGPTNNTLQVTIGGGQHMKNSSMNLSKKSMLQRNNKMSMQQSQASQKSRTGNAMNSSMARSQALKQKNSAHNKTQNSDQNSQQQQNYGKGGYTYGGSYNTSNKVFQAPEDSDVDLNSSFKTQMTKVSGGNMKLNSITSKIGQKGGLTKELLHPEQALLEKVVLPTETIIDGLKDTIEGSRQRNAFKNQRSQQLSKKITQIKQELQVREERMVLERKKQQMQHK